MAELDESQHIFRHIKKSWMDGDTVTFNAFLLREDEAGQVIERGLSVNWVEYFKKDTPQQAIPELRATFEQKGRGVGGQSRFALLNVGAVHLAAAEAKCTPVSVILDAPDDPSHASIEGYTAYNYQMALELSKVVIDSYPAKP